MIKLERDNLHMFCRTCLERLQSSCDTSEKNESTENYDIREAPELTKLLIICTTLNINEDVDAVYPQRVCSKCYRTLQDFKQFREMAIKSGEVLRGIVENSDGVLIAENAEAEKHLTSKPDSQASDDFGSNFEVSQTDMSDPFYNMYENEAEHDAQASRSKEIKVESAMDEDDSLILYENQADSAAENEADASAGEVFPSTSKAAIKRKRVDDADDGERFPCTFEGCKAVFTTNKSLQAHWKESHDTDFNTSSVLSSLPSWINGTDVSLRDYSGNFKPSGKKFYTNRKQFYVMVEHMKKNPDIARSVSRVPSDVEAFWNELKIKLNAYGPPYKDISSWKKVWTDYKSGIRKKVAALEAGTLQGVRLNKLEEEVNNLVRRKRSCPKTRAFSIQNRSMKKAAAPSAKQSKHGIVEELEIPPPTSEIRSRKENTETTSRKETQDTLSTNAILQNQLRVQKALLEKISTEFDITKEIEDKRALDRLNEHEKMQTILEEQTNAERKRHNLAIKKLAMENLRIEKNILGLKLAKSSD